MDAFRAADHGSLPGAEIDKFDGLHDQVQRVLGLRHNEFSRRRVPQSLQTNLDAAATVCCCFCQEDDVPALELCVICSHLGPKDQQHITKHQHSHTKTNANTEPEPNRHGQPICPDCSNAAERSVAMVRTQAQTRQM